MSYYRNVFIVDFGWLCVSKAYAPFGDTGTLPCLRAAFCTLHIIIPCVGSWSLARGYQGSFFQSIELNRTIPKWNTIVKIPRFDAFPVSTADFVEIRSHSLFYLIVKSVL